MADEIPCWLGARAQAVAEALIADGFWYVGLAENFCTFPEEEEINPDSWVVCGSYQEIGIDVIHDGALFFRDFDEDLTPEQFQEELEKVKRTISQTQLAWDTCANAGQLSLPGVA